MPAVIPSSSRRLRRPGVVGALALAALTLGHGPRASAFTATCNPANPTGNVTTVLCAATSTCTATAVTVNENIDVTSGGCDFDLGGRTLTFQKTFQMTGAGYIQVVNAGNITVTGNAKLKARGDFVEPNGIIIQGGMITFTSSGVITLQNGALIDVSGDPAGTITFTAAGAQSVANFGLAGINLANGTELRGVGQSSFVDAGDRFTDGGTISLTTTAGGIFDSAAMNLPGANQGQGGEVDMLAALGITIAQAIDAHGGGGDGGTIDITAGDDIQVLKNIDVSSNLGGGFGGDLSLAAGEDTIGVPGGVAGGALTLDAAGNAQLKANGSDLETSGGDGGDIELSAAGAITVTVKNTVNIQANGGSMFDGSGGTIFIDSGDANPNAIGALDGDIVLGAGISASGGGESGDGGEVDLSAGRNLTINAPITMTGEDSGGDLSGDSGGTTTLNGVIDVHASGPTGEAGSVDFVSGLGAGGSAGAFSLQKNVVATAGAQNGGSESVSFAGCTMSVAGTVKVDGTGGTNTQNISGGADIEFVSVGAMLFASGSQYLAPPAGLITLTHPSSVVPQKTGAIFNPAPPVDNVRALGSPVYPNCPVCGDGIRQVGEVCDKGAAADGACCNSTCTAFVCVTPTPTATATATRTATPTTTPGVATATRTVTPSPTATVAATATRTATPVVATPTATVTLAAATATATRTATPTPGSTATATPTSGATATVTSTRTASATPTATLTPTATVSATPTVTVTATPLPGATATLTATPTATATATGTATATATPTSTSTATPTATASPTSTATTTVSPTLTATGTPTPTPSATPTLTGVATPTLTATATGTPSATPTVTVTRTATPSATRSLTPSASVTTTPSGPPTSTPTPQANSLTAKAADKCQRAITRAGAIFIGKRLKSLDKCANGVLRCVQEKATDPTCLPKATIACSDEMIGTFAALRTNFAAAVAKKCEGGALTIADLLDLDTLGFQDVQAECAALGSPLNDIGAVGDCVLAQHECEAERLFELQEPRAGELLDLVRAGGATFDALPCLTDHGAGGATSDPRTLGKAVDKCEAQLKSSGTKFALATLRGLTACATGVLTCDLTKPGDDGCLAKAGNACTKGLAKIGAEGDKLAPAIDKRCGAAAINFDALRAATGANLDALTAECAAFGIPAIGSMADYETCLARQHACGGEELTRFEVPRVEELLGMISPPATLRSPFCPAP